jgi:hypothetical protein
MRLRVKAGSRVGLQKRIVPKRVRRRRAGVPMTAWLHFQSGVLLFSKGLQALTCVFPF